MSQNVFIPPIGFQGNAWNNVAVAANGYSNVIDTFNQAHVSIFGNGSGAATLQVQYSADGVSFYNAGTITLSGAGNFYLDVQMGARYVRIQSSAAITLTATVSAKQ